MKTGILMALAVAGAAMVALPASAADQGTFVGSCHITGISTFVPNLTSNTQKIKYDFHSGSPDGGTTKDATACTGKLNGKSITNEPASAAVSGYGNLSCSSGSSADPGTGALVIDGYTFPFTFTFTATLTEVDYVADNTASGGDKATGHASFAKYAPPDTPAKCAGSGVNKLGFEADNPSTVPPGQPPYKFVGSKESAASGGGGGSTGGGGATGTGGGSKTSPSSHGSKRAQCIKKAKKIKNKKARQKAIAKCKKKYKH
jgi:hypothetical protein